MANGQKTSGTDVLLLLKVPRTNVKKELAAEQLFASLQGLLSIPSIGLLRPPTRERISLEIAAIKNQIGFYVWVPDYLKSFVEEQIYAQYPTVQMSEVNDFSKVPLGQYTTALGCELKLTANDALPIKTFQSFEVDPLAAITATLAKFNVNEEAWIQLLIRPAPSAWHRKSERYIARLMGQEVLSVKNVLSTLLNSSGPQAYSRLTDAQQTRLTSAQSKSHKLAYETSLRIVYRGNRSFEEAKLQLQSIISSYQQFNSTYLNGFDLKKVTSVESEILRRYRSREFQRPGFMCNIEEIATLFHLPHTSVETPHIKWSSAHTAEPPGNLPLVTSNYDTDVSPIAATNFRGHNTMFGLNRSDRSRHLYILGQTGVGKSGLLELLTISDIHSSYGFAVIDPHGDYAMNILKRIPEERIDDVIYFNPADVNSPVAFNPMEVYDPKLKNHTCSELIGVLKRIFDAWGPRLEYILRYSILALLDYPGATMLDITRILTDANFRQEVVAQLSDPVVRNFWTVEFASWSGRAVTDAVAPVLNKIGAFTANPLIRNIIGQENSSFNIRKIMDENKILIINLSRGLVGEDNAALLGALLVTKIQLAAMSRADTTIDKRSPFYLYVDEFQNFATDSFTTILSEARKYGLNLTVANQYIAQMMPSVRDAVFGNVGSLISFRTSADDARTMQKYFEPKFTDSDLVQMHNRNFVISMTIDGEKAPAFSGVSLNLPTISQDNSQAIIELSRSRYGKPRDEIERSVSDRYFSELSNTQVLDQAKSLSTKPKKTPKRSGSRSSLAKAAVSTLVGDDSLPRSKRIKKSTKNLSLPREILNSEPSELEHNSIIRLH